MHAVTVAVLIALVAMAVAGEDLKDIRGGLRFEVYNNCKCKGKPEDTFYLSPPEKCVVMTDLVTNEMGPGLSVQKTRDPKVFAISRYAAGDEDCKGKATSRVLYKVGAPCFKGAKLVVNP